MDAWDDAARFADGRLVAALRARAAILAAIRGFFSRRGFVEVDPPQLAHSPGLELHLDAVRAVVRTGMGGPPVERWLVTSPEYHCKRLLAAGLPRIYSLQHAFRSGERGGHHNPEFMMLEWYRAGADWRAIAADVRALVAHCARRLLADPAIATEASPLARSLALGRRWPTLSVRGAIRRFGGFDPGLGLTAEALARRARKAGLDVRPGDTAADIFVQALVERVEPRLRGWPAVVLAPWPACLASLARRDPARPDVAERFEIYLAGVELANGFSELTDPVEQRARLDLDLARRRALDRPLYPIDERFLAALARGMPSAGGVALGVDRMLMALLGRSEIGLVMAFPFEAA